MKWGSDANEKLHVSIRDRRFGGFVVGLYAADDTDSQCAAAKQSAAHG